MRIRNMGLFLFSTFFLCATTAVAFEKVEATPASQYEVLSKTESNIIAAYGPGEVVLHDKWNPLRKTLTYWDKNEHVWVQFRMECGKNVNSKCVIREILISKNRLSKKRVPILADSGLLELMEVVGASVRSSDIETKYGKPTLAINLYKESGFSVLSEYFGFKSGRVYRYLPQGKSDLFFMEFYFDKSGLHSVLISKEE